MNENGHSTNGTPGTNGTFDRSKPVANGDHGPDGRFRANNRAACGRSHGRRGLALKDALLDEVTPQTLRAVAKKLVSMAKAGNIEATKVLFTWVLGKPAEQPQSVELADLRPEGYSGLWP